MEQPYLVLSYYQVGLAALLILINGGISVLLRLGLERRLLVAAACTVVQLLLIGLVLEWVFRVSRWYVVLALMLAMTLIAGVAATQRARFRYPGIWLASIASVWASSWAMGSLALFVLVRVRPWYAPQYAIPLLGMILGNTLNGISLGLDRLCGGACREASPGRGRPRPRCDTLGGGPRADPAGGPHRLDPDPELDDGRRHREPARHDDGANPCRGEPA